LLFTAKFGLTDDTQPVPLSVNLKFTFPALTAVISPLLFIVATEGLLLTHTPPDVGDTLDVSPIQSDVVPVTEIVGLGFTVSEVVVIAWQPLMLLVKVKLTMPGAIAVISPLLLTAAIFELLLIHVPPEDGKRFVLLPTHNVVGPVNPMFSGSSTLIGTVLLDVQVVELSTNLNVVDP
jgi:hypothetical protein